jgi:hypothetical protein
LMMLKSSLIGIFFEIHSVSHALTIYSL